MPMRDFKDNLNREYNQPFSGWDFSHLDGRRVEEPPPWSYESMARDCLAGASSALDLGTGGGERLLELRDVFPARVAATEGHPPNLRLARERLAPYGGTVYESSSALAEMLPFADESFDLVLDRHTAFNASEVARVLTRDGIFLTQQVDGKRTDLQAAFEAEAQWPYFTLDFLLNRMQGLPLAIESAQEWTGEVRFTDVGAVVYYLKAVPWIVPHFGIETHLPYLEKLQRRLEVDGALTFHQTLMLVRAKKQSEGGRM
jgi:SAM-dependent methyltransferase